MGEIGWRAGVVGAAAGAVTMWLVAPWMSMAVHGTVDDRRTTWLRRQGAARVERPDGADGAAGSPRMPRAWDTIPGPRPLVRDRSGAAPSAQSAPSASSAPS